MGTSVVIVSDLPLSHNLSVSDCLWLSAYIWRGGDRAMYRYKQAERLENATNFKLLYQYMGGTLSDYVTHLAARGQGA